MDINSIWNFELRRGNSTDPSHGACLLDAVSWFEYGTLGDHPGCVCSVIASFCRCANDFMNDAGRQRLKVFIPRLPGSVDIRSQEKRCEYLLRLAINDFAPYWLDQALLIENAKYLRNFSGNLYDAEKNIRNIRKLLDRKILSQGVCYRSLQHIIDSIRCTSLVGSAKYAASACVPMTDIPYSLKYEDMLIAAIDGVLKIGRQAESMEPERFIKANETFKKARLLHGVK